MTQVTIENPILNSPFAEPRRHFRFDEQGITPDIAESRRVSSYFMPIARPKRHTLGNLTLLTKPLNSKVSNGAWTGPEGKRAALDEHDVLMLNNDLRKRVPTAWTHDHIKARTDEMIDAIVEIWAVPAGHRLNRLGERQALRRKLDLADLINAGVLQAGTTLYPGRKKFAGRTATLLADGSIEVDGVAYEYPQSAAKAIAGRPDNGWWFFRVDRVGGRSLRDVLDDYRATIDAEPEVDEGPDDREADDEVETSGV